MTPDFTFSFGRPENDDTEELNAPAYKIAVLGDFRGHQPQAAEQKTRCRRVDIDTFDDVLREWSPALELSLGGNDELAVQVAVEELEDFHPDSLYERLPAFAALRELTAKLKNPATFAEAAAALALANQDAPAESNPPESTESESPAAEDDDSPGAQTLEDLLDRPSQPSPSKGTRIGRTDLVNRLIRTAVDPHVVPEKDPRLDACLEHVNALTANLMRMILHHPCLQELEALWRGLDILVRTLPPEDVEIRLIDAPRDRLSDALVEHEACSGWLHDCLPDKKSCPPGETPCDLIVAAYRFDGCTDDIALLSQLARLGHRCGALLITAANPTLAGAASVANLPHPEMWNDLAGEAAKAWTQLRNSPSARNTVIALPDFLGRLPYGRRGEPIDSFPFEEVDKPDDLAQYTWANPAFLGTLLIAEQALAENDDAAPTNGVVEDIPFFTYVIEGRTETLPPAQVWLPDRAAEQLRERGLSPVQSIRGRNAVRALLRPLRA